MEVPGGLHTAHGVPKSWTSLFDPKVHALYASRLLALRWDEGKIWGNEISGRGAAAGGEGRLPLNLLLPSPSVS